MPKKTLLEFFSDPPPSPLAKIPGSAHDTTVKPTVLDAHAHLCLLTSEAEKVNLVFYDGVAERFYIAIAMSESGEFSCKPMKERQLMGESQRRGVRTPPPEKSPK